MSEKSKLNYFKRTWKNLLDSFKVIRTKYLDSCADVEEDHPMWDMLSDIDSLLINENNQLNSSLDKVDKEIKEYQSIIQNNIKNIGFKYSNWNLLFNDAWNETFSSKQEFYDDRFIQDLKQKVFDNDELSKSEKVSVVENIFAEWENHFYDSRFQVLEKVISNAIDLAGQQNLRYLKNNIEELSWFTIIDDDEGEISINLVDYENPFQFEHLKELLIFPDDPEFLDLDKDNLIQDFNNEVEGTEYLNRSYKGDVEIETVEFGINYSDDRWFFVGSKNDYNKYSKEWNESIDRIINDVKEMYIENKSLFSSKSSNSL